MSDLVWQAIIAGIVTVVLAALNIWRESQAVLRAKVADDKTDAVKVAAELAADKVEEVKTALDKSTADKTKLLEEAATKAEAAAAEQKQAIADNTAETTRAKEAALAMVQASAQTTKGVADIGDLVNGQRAKMLEELQAAMLRIATLEKVIADAATVETLKDVVKTVVTEAVAAVVQPKP